MQKNNYRRFDTVTVTVAAMLTAISIVIGIFCKNFLNFGGGLFRITFENLPIILSGIMYGPLVGGMVGVATDLVSYLLSSQIYPPNLIVTLGCAMVGITSGVISRYVIKSPGKKQIIVSGMFAHLIGSMVIKSIGLYTFYGMYVLVRIPMYLIIATIEIVIICLLYKNSNFRGLWRMHKGGHMSLNYADTLKYIHSVSWLGSRPGLNRITELCERLGNPQDSLSFVHVTGTNGKGSTCAMTESILRHAGYKTGLFTSPYVRYFNERIAINGQPVSNELLCKATETVKKHADKMKDSPTEFELITAIALVIFSLEKCDAVIFEVGMGGRLDSTNVIKSSLVSVVTGVSLDHTAVLGNSVTAIAKEKAGIIKSGSHVLYGGKDFECDGSNGGEAFTVIRDVATEKNAPFDFCDYTQLKIKKTDLCGSVFDYKGYKDVSLSLLGLYQPENAVKAIEVAEILRVRGYKISDEDIYEGLKNAKWAARFEKLSEDPLVIYDGSHNPEGIEAARVALSHYFGQEKVNLLTGVMADKDYSVMAETLSPFAKKVFAVTPDNPRSLPSSKLAELYRGLGVPSESFDSVYGGFCTAYLDSKKNKIPLICLGSLYMYCEVAEAHEKITEKNKGED